MNIAYWNFATTKTMLLGFSDDLQRYANGIRSSIQSSRSFIGSPFISSIKWKISHIRSSFITGFQLHIVAWTCSYSNFRSFYRLIVLFFIPLKPECKKWSNLFLIMHSKNSNYHGQFLITFADGCRIIFIRFP